MHGAEARARFSRILGSQVGTKIYKKTNKKSIGNRTQIGMGLGWLSASILDDFGGKLGAKMRPKIAKMRSQSRSKNCTKKCTKKWSVRDAGVCERRGGSVLNNQSIPRVQAPYPEHSITPLRATRGTVADIGTS